MKFHYRFAMLLFMSFATLLSYSPHASAVIAATNCRTTSVTVSGESGPPRVECDYVNTGPEGASGAGVPTNNAGSGAPSAGTVDAEKVLLCRGSKNLYNIMGCKDIPQIAPSAISDLGLPPYRQFNLLWGASVLGLANAAFKGNISDTDFSQAVTAGLSSCQQETGCVSEVFVFYGITPLPVGSPYLNVANYLLNALNIMLSGPRSFKDSDAYNAAKKWEGGGYCAALRKSYVDNQCGAL